MKHAMFLGYNTNGLAHHDPFDAVALLAELGYQGIALTIDHGLCSPRDSHWQSQAAALRRALEQANMRSVIETGARYLLNPRVKHAPTLVSPRAEERAGRSAFLRHAIDVAVELGSDCVSFWSGIVQDGADDATAETRLISAIQPVVEYAASRAVVLAFEPEPGMFIDTMARFQWLHEQIQAEHFRLTLDIGHLHCLGETPLADYIRRWGRLLANIHIEDMRASVHEHLMFGEGEIDFPPVIDALREVGYQGGLYVELSRHSHDGPRAASQALRFLRGVCDSSDDR